MGSNLDYTQDLKISNTSEVDKHGDVEQGSPPPLYPLAESEELVVGGKPKSSRWRCFRRHRCCGRNAESRSNGDVPQRQCWVLRVFKFLLVGWILLGVVHFVVAGVKFHKSFKTLECTTIIPATTNGELQFTLPVAHSSDRIFVHDSLTGGDSYITRDPTVANGTVKLTLDFSEDGQQDETVYDGCMVQLKRGTGVALISRESHGAHAQIASLGLRFPDSVVAPAVQFIGEKDFLKKRLSDEKLRKLIKWWRKHHNKEE